MNNPLNVVESARWNRLSRRWSILLGVLLTVNLALVAVAVSGYAASQGPLLLAGISDAEQVAVTTEPQSDPVVASSESVADEGTLENGVAVQVGVAAGTPSILDSTSEPVVTGNPAGELQTQEPAVAAAVKTPESPAENGTAPTPELTQTALVIVNPPTTGGIVHLVVDEVLLSLEPGTFQRLAGQKPRRIVFHRGEDFENVELSVESGVFAFTVSAAGWQLEAANSGAAELLSSCRPAAQQ